MTVPQEQVLEVRACRPDGNFGVGSGFLLPGRLALTAAHVVFGDSGEPFDQVQVRVGNGKEFVRAEVVWPTRRGAADAALLEIVDSGWIPPRRVRAVRWGKITGSGTEIPCDATGFPRVLRDPDTGRDTDQISGFINPGNRLRGGRYDINLQSTAPAPVGSPWAGMSGAALFSGDLLIGIVIIDTPGFAERRLTAEPVFKLAADPTFVTSLMGPESYLEPESVELVEMFGPSRRQSSSPSRARLLDAAAEVVPFRGREELMARLRAWCETEDDFAAQLIVGPGGQGKTRLARELCRRLRRAGWIAGLVYEDVPRAVINRLADTSERVLLVVDVAEARTGQIAELIEAAWRRPDGAEAIRLLMLARSDGDWWQQLRRKMPDPLGSATCIALPDLEENWPGRVNAYRDAMQAFANRLNEAEPTAGWPVIVSRLVQPDMRDAKFGSVLTLHMAALTALLQGGPDPVKGPQDERPEDVLLDHEMQYWQASQKRYRTAILRRAVAAATLCGAADEEEASALLGGLKRLRDMRKDDRAALVDWIRDLYPVPSGHVWGYLQPDRLGEHLIRRVVHDERDFLDDVRAGASAAQKNRAIAVFARIGGRLHEDGTLAEARQWYERAAVAGHNDAAYRLGELLYQGGTPAEARPWYERAAVAGHNDAAYRLGELLYQGGTPAEARQWFTRAATAGHYDAAYKLGELLREDGKPAEAKKWYMRAAAGDHASAAHELGGLLRIEGDHLGAMYWWRTAAEGGLGGAAFELAELLVRDGKPDEARQWYERAANLRHWDAAFTLAEVLWREGKPAEARQWYEEAAKDGHAYAAYQLGWLILQTEGDAAEAASCWRTAAAGGEEKARPLELAEVLWREGKPAEARQWYEEAAKDGDAYAAYQLGWLILQTEGDAAEAASCWRTAAAGGEEKARPLELAEVLWREGKPAEARQWYEEAAKDGDAYAASQLGWLILQTEGDHAEAAS